MKTKHDILSRSKKNTQKTLKKKTKRGNLSQFDILIIQVAYLFHF